MLVFPLLGSCWRSAAVRFRLLASGPLPATGVYARMCRGGMISLLFSATVIHFGSDLGKIQQRRHVSQFTYEHCGRGRGSGISPQRNPDWPSRSFQSDGQGDH